MPGVMGRTQGLEPLTLGPAEGRGGSELLMLEAAWQTQESELRLACFGLSHVLPAAAQAQLPLVAPAGSR